MFPYFIWMFSSLSEPWLYNISPQKLLILLTNPRHTNPIKFVGIHLYFSWRWGMFKTRCKGFTGFWAISSSGAELEIVCMFLCQQWCFSCGTCCVIHLICVNVSQVLSSVCWHHCLHDIIKRNQYRTIFEHFTWFKNLLIYSNVEPSIVLFRRAH